MPALTDDERQGLRVDNFIFHAVHHGEPEPTLFDEVPIGGFAPFFVGRVVDTLKGNRFAFDPGSETLAALRGLETDPTAFVDTSKELARRFHRDDGRFKRGILIVTTLATGTRRLHSLIKLDYEDDVVTFEPHGVQAALSSVMRPLTRSPKALQKSALVELADGGGALVVVDHGKRSGITDFFQGFLGVRRARDEAEMTAAVAKVLLRTVQDQMDALPVDITSRVKPRLAEIAAMRGEFEADRVFGDFFGAHGTDEVRATYDRQLTRQGLEGEAFAFDEASLPTDGPRRYRTREGITINVPDAARDTIRFETQPDGSTVVTIRSAKVGER